MVRLLWRLLAKRWTMSSGSGTKWGFFIVLAGILLIVAAGIGGYFYGKSKRDPAPPAPERQTITEIQRDTLRTFIPVTRYVERIERDTMIVTGEPISDAELDSMQMVLDRERRVYFAADTTVDQHVIVLNPDGTPVVSSTFTDPLSLLCYPSAGYIAVQRGKQPWEIRLPVPLERIPSFFEVIWDRFKTGTAYAFIGGALITLILLGVGAI